MDTSKFVKFVSCQSAADMVNALAPTSEYFEREDPNSWAFRGLSDYRYKLVPSALRAPDALKPFVPQSCRTNAEQIAAELRVLIEFFELADLRGLPLPEDSQMLRRLLERLRNYAGTRTLLDSLKSGQATWPPSELLSLAGLAQHYGLPTRMLDWTFSPFIAAYFAASGVLRAVKEAPSKRELIKEYCRTAGTELNNLACEHLSRYPGRFCVWAFSLDVDFILRLMPETPSPYKFVSMPYAGNPNIGAQQGLFTVSTPTTIDPEAEVDRSSFDEKISRVAESQWDMKSPDAHLFLCFHLDNSEVFKLLRLLAKYGVSASTVYPGYKGVCDTVAEKLWWWTRNASE